MSFGDWLVVAMGVLYAVAVVAYGIQSEWGKVLYFGGAVVMTVGILIMKG